MGQVNGDTLPFAVLLSSTWRRRRAFWSISAATTPAGTVGDGRARARQRHGTDAAIEAVPGTPRVCGAGHGVKTLASALIIGSADRAGGKAPRHGSAAIEARAQTTKGRAGAGHGRQDVGIGSGIGAIFRTPLGGAVLGAEIL